jgi:membrane-associated phospholipid phosphatase
MHRHLESPSTLAPAVAAGLAFAVVARVAAVDEPTPLDHALHRFATASYRRWFELLQLPIEVAGYPGAYIPVAAVAAASLRRRGVRGGNTILTAACAGWLALRVARLLYRRVRPPRPRHRGPKAESSFPSGHTTGVTASAVATAMVLAREEILSPRSAGLLGVGVPLVTGFNRVYVREHWATDVIGGWLLGAAVGLSCVWASSTRTVRA